MTFTYTYRDRTGAKREGRIAAASRDAAFAALKSRGISPLSIREGNGRAACSHAAENGNADNGRVGAPRPPQPRSDGTRIDAAISSKPPYLAGRRLPAVLGILTLLALLGGGAWWWFVNGRGTDDLPEETPEKASMPKIIKKVVPSQNKVTMTQMSTNRVVHTSPATVTNNPYNGNWQGKKIVSYLVKTNGWSTYERIVTEDGKSHGVIGTTVKPVFDNGSDQMLALAIRASKDTEMPPMPFSPMMESDFLASLKKPIIINDGDSDEVKQLKRDVMQAREDMIDLMNKGMTVQQALEEHFKMSNENVGIRNKAVNELRAILDSGDEEGAIKYMETVNPMLERMGAMKLELPEERIKGRKRRSAIEVGEKL